MQQRQHMLKQLKNKSPPVGDKGEVERERISPSNIFKIRNSQQDGKVS
jgi:hydrogenase maturation factor HypF (carbamoyltransferase family)